MTHISRSYSLHLAPVNQLPKDGVDKVAYAPQHGTQPSIEALSVREYSVNHNGVAMSSVCYNTSVSNECSPFALGSVTIRPVFRGVVSKRNVLCFLKRWRVLCRLTKSDFPP